MLNPALQEQNRAYATIPVEKSGEKVKKSSRLWMNSVISVMFYDDKIAVYRAHNVAVWLRVMDFVHLSYTEARSVPPKMFEENSQYQMTGNDVPVYSNVV